MKAYLLFPMIVIVLFASCSQKFGMERGIVPAVRADIAMDQNGPALFRSRTGDIAIEAVQKREWEDLLRSPVFRDKNQPLDARIPKLHFFQLIVINLADRPLRVARITARYGKTIQPCLSIAEIKKKCASPAYAVYRMANILTPRLLFDEKNIAIKKIDYEKNSIAYRFDFVNPGERLMRIVAFDWIPVEYRQFSMGIELQPVYGPAEKKIVDFTFIRTEYRSQGHHFIRPKPQQGRHHHEN